VRSAIAISILSFVVAALTVRWLSRGRIGLDQPNARSLHATPVPRTGGIGLLAGIGAGWAFGEPNWSWPLWTALMLVVIVSLLDDLCGLSIFLRLAAHILAAVLVVPAALEPQASWMLIVFAVLATGWMCNLYNFMDGSDGLAGGMTLIGFLSYSAAAWLAGSTQFAMLNLAISAAAGGFLLFNFHPARIFLGDAGAVPLGFLAAIFGLIGWRQDAWTWWFPLLVFSPFIVDASVTLLRRLFSGARFWEAHRDHYYQRLVQLGLGHRGTAFAEYALMSACAVTALGALNLPPWGQYAVLGGGGLVYLFLIAGIERGWRRRVIVA
jgi:UDP-N-acetylmuramyl pentapeptide phosphotransferase/UDP-N-acetylglucosamine-1-phosphate transferase